ncbi:MAG: glycoside hydrolase family 36 protein [Chloroflexota bacterium]|jgi:alpha-galactosidase|nr:glycoside hydrolase family 36 protein [Chloroflexota bacterium]
MQLRNDDLILTISEDSPHYELRSQSVPGCALRSSYNIRCEKENQKVNLLHNTFEIQNLERDIFYDMPWGTLTCHRLTLSTTLSGVQLLIDFGISTAKGMAFLRMEIQNNSDEDLNLQQFIPLDAQSGDIRLGNHQQIKPAFYSSGWQSWSCTGTYGLDETQRTSNIGPFQNPMVVNPGTPQPRRKNHFTGDMFGVLGDRTSRIGLLAGFLSQIKQFGSLEAAFNPQPALKVWANGDNVLLPAGEAAHTDWLALSFIHLDAPEPMSAYLESVAEHNEVQSNSPVPVGWCSWYHYYQDISEEIIQSNLEAVVQLKPECPLPLLQIDDGFETYPGDWFDFTPEFPHGLSPIAQQVKDAGLTPGIWLAPFIVHPKANLVKDHPDWLLRDEEGKPVSAGFVWNAFTYALDLTHPDALDYTCDVIRTAVEDWGFDFLKLDFLYAAALEGVYQDPTQTRAQVLRRGFEALRQAAGPDVTLLACGCPLGSALGLFDAMRISADVNGYWEPHFPPVSFLLKKEPHMPAARNALQNILTRAPLHRHWWINDPDCLLVRPDTDLTLPEVQTLTSAIGLTGGSILLSDDLPALPRERLKLAQILLPAIDRRARVLDWFDSFTPARLRVDLNGTCGPWHLLAWFNWKDQPASYAFSPQAFDLPEGEVWWLREFWTGLIGQMSEKSPLAFNDNPPHGVRVAAVRPYDTNTPVYLGSDLHISQGLEINEWQAEDKALTLRFDLGREASGRAHLYLPWKPVGAWFRGESQMIQDEGRGVYAIDLKELDRQELVIKG